MACTQSTAAITVGRTLLTDPDPVPELTGQLTTALRNTLGSLSGSLIAAFKAGQERLGSSQVWGRLTDEQRATLTTAHQLTPPAKETFGTDEEIIIALRASSLPDRRNLLDAVPQRFARALDQASQLLEPKAVRVILPSATIKNTAELANWISDVREQVEESLKDGPVIL